ncbi:MAG TPA: T9SS type A sorting domain-containing protein [Bacteroidia bacterium]|nr:T9SS type A sorting domain-containing protein [Bacteroidia bacterium]HNP97425.1 T9SS type A sorting domain-containing protein [Bacteroidia bacterium]
MRRIYPLFALFFLFYYEIPLIFGQTPLQKEATESVMSSKDFQRIQWLSSFRPLAKVNQLYDDVFHVFSNADSICYGYFPSGLPDTDLDYTWNGNAWDLAYRTLHTNTSDGQPFVLTGQNFLGQWENAKKDSFAYGANHLVSDHTSFYYDPLQQEWMNSKRSLFNYSLSNQLTEQTDQVFVQNSWLNQLHYVSLVAADSTVSEYRTERWDSVTLQWNPERKSEYFYDTDKKLINTFVYRWHASDSTWYHVQRWSVAYDTLQLPISYLFENYDTVSMDYYNGSLLQYTYDSDQNLVYSIFQNWIVQENEWENENQFFYYYEPWTTTEEIEEKNAILIFPNPVKDYIHICGRSEKEKKYSLVISDASGQIVERIASLTLPYVHDLSFLPDGNYSVQLIRSGFKATSFQFIKVNHP